MTDIVNVPATPLAPLDVEKTKQAMSDYQAGLHALMVESDWQVFTDKQGESHRFLKRSGWRKIGLWFGLNFELQSQEIDRDNRGRPVRVRVVYRALAQNGRWADGEGGADSLEMRGNKPEHDLIATAGTRALNRAISNLVGLGAVSAEEVEGDNASPYGPLATDTERARAISALEAMLPGVDGADILKLMTDTFGVLPQVVCRTLSGLSWYMDNRVKEWAQEGTQGGEPYTPPIPGQTTVDEMLQDNGGDSLQEGH